MKKLLIVILSVILVLSGCDKKEERPLGITTEIAGAKEVDMSSYQDMSDYDHRFLEVKATDLLDLLNDEGSGIFYLGSTSCPVCQFLVRYMDEAAEELNTTIYYIDVYDEEGTFEKAYQDVYDALYDVLGEVDGTKVLQTPHVLTVIDGKIAASLVGAVDGYDGTEATADLMIDHYRAMFEPFKAE